MTKFFTSTFTVINLYKKNSIKSEIVTQLIYGESFSILKKTSKWLKIKIKEDGYKGYVQIKNFKSYIASSHKVKILKAIVYKSPNLRSKIHELTFGSKIKVIDKKLKFFKFEKGWIKQDDVKPNAFKEKNLFLKVSVALVHCTFENMNIFLSCFCRRRQQPEASINMVLAFKTQFHSFYRCCNAPW